MKDNNVGDLMGLTIDKIRELADVNTIIGQPIKEGNVTLIPISKVAYGFASGGSDFPSKSQSQLFGGGGGAGINITPIAFIVIENGSTKILHIDTCDNTVEKLINAIPGLVDKVTEVIEKKKKEKEEKNNNQDELL